MPSLCATASHGTLLLALLAGVGACHGCHDDAKPKEHAPPEHALSNGAACTSAADCAKGSPCAQARCIDGHCRARLAPAGTSCDNANVCDGIARCDDNGVCRPGAPPALDDNNACTIDSCDPVKGVMHQPVEVDDHDVCTADGCDPVSGITHTAVDIDDGDDCTFDSCDPEAGVTHKKPESTYTCNAGCGAGYHPVSRSASTQCGDRGQLQTFCAPDCGNAFYSCDDRCPPRYHVASRSASTRCGAKGALYAFCQKDDEAGFYTCDPRCPDGYRQTTSAPTTHCGPDTSTMIRCVGAR